MSSASISNSCKPFLCQSIQAVPTGAARFNGALDLDRTYACATECFNEIERVSSDAKPGAASWPCPRWPRLAGPPRPNEMRGRRFSYLNVAELSAVHRLNPV